ncbi:uncharacterized protein ZC3H3 [Battus philenor]|uniref:uncharacterized protein ZC3H3 n=1 Tax=Battus philenor TaxID=42288 RepID=UPI0035D11106
MERSLNRVYINPNFEQRSHVTTIPFPSTNNMHINPYFPQVKLKNDLEQNANISKRRIFVNPNFIKPNQTFDIGTSVLNLPSLHTATHNTLMHKSTNVVISDNQVYLDQTNKECSKPVTVFTPSPSKSRYVFIRKTDSCVKNVDKSAMTKKKITIKISKYKTARLSYVKKHIAEESKKTRDKLLPVAQTNKSLYKEQEDVLQRKIQIPVARKFVKINKQTTPKKLAESKAFVFKNMTRNVRKSNVNYQFNEKTVPGRFKKHNIPCPLFSKYGKCLRNVHGNCEFLHDKKHVSVCRKFLKGICHDALCSFSHEISAKKMPTCYFYLKGNCNKDNCPYLHVKLNNKAELCKEFLKGYCEKGEQCIYRHVNKELKTVVKYSMNNKRQYSGQTSSFIISKTFKIKSNYNKKKELKRKSMSNNESGIPGESDPKSRYFKKCENECEQQNICNVIKPSRCKLGTLPSFIKL